MTVLSEATIVLLNRYAETHDYLAAAHSFLKEMLKPYAGDSYLTYRYEHSLRVMRRGLQIAEGEGWDAEPLMIACLLHDVGYPECHTPEEFSRHQEVSAQIAAFFLDRIGYDRDVSKAICRGIFLHNLWDDVPGDASPFELSVRDADDLDRFDALRTCMKGNAITGNAFICDRSAAEVIEGCRTQLEKIEADSRHLCATVTARNLWNDQLRERRAYYEILLRHMNATLEAERLLAGIDGK